jgi:hypothetical protein
MKVQKYKMNLPTDSLPFDGYNPQGSPVFLPNKKNKTQDLIGFISLWDIVTETATITLFEPMNFKPLTTGLLIKKEDIVAKKITDEELQNDIRTGIRIPFAKWVDEISEMCVK